MVGEDLNNATIISNDIFNEITRIKEQEGKNILIFGSPSVSQLLMQHNLIDDYWIFVNPIIFGEGIPLFTTFNNKIKLKLLETTKFSNGEIALNYSVA